jgi:polyketide synthase PksN
MTTQESTIAIIKKLISDETGIAISEIKETDSFFNLGLDSVSCIFLMDKLEKQLHIELNPIHFWDYPTIDTYSEFIVQEYLTKHGN